MESGRLDKDLRVLKWRRMKKPVLESENLKRGWNKSFGESGESDNGDS